jgi:hypothetical protein
VINPADRSVAYLLALGEEPGRDRRTPTARRGGEDCRCQTCTVRQCRSRQNTAIYAICCKIDSNTRKRDVAGSAVRDLHRDGRGLPTPRRQPRLIGAKGNIVRYQRTGRGHQQKQPYHQAYIRPSVHTSPYVFLTHHAI